MTENHAGLAKMSRLDRFLDNFHTNFFSCSAWGRRGMHHKLDMVEEPRPGVSQEPMQLVAQRHKRTILLEYLQEKALPTLLFEATMPLSQYMGALYIHDPVVQKYANVSLNTLAFDVTIKPDDEVFQRDFEYIAKLERLPINHLDVLRQLFLPYVI